MLSRFRCSLMLGLALLCSPVLRAQTDLFGTPEAVEPVHRGFIISVNGNFDLPGADMADRFGKSFRLGPALQYKTKSNFVFGLKFDFILGNQIREANYMANILDDNGFLININGSRERPGLFERGYAVGLQAGKIFSLSGRPSDNGLLLLTGAGFMQHRINIFDRDNTMNQIKPEYRKGYDRLSNGVYVEQYAGYTLFDKSGIFNINLGLNALVGFTQGRRDYQFDLMGPGNGKRLDLLLGARLGLSIALFKRKSEELIFEVNPGN